MGEVRKIQCLRRAASLMPCAEGSPRAPRQEAAQPAASVSVDSSASAAASSGVAASNAGSAAVAAGSASSTCNSRDKNATGC